MHTIVWDDKSVTYQVKGRTQTTKPFPTIELAREFAKLIENGRN